MDIMFESCHGTASRFVEEKLAKELMRENH
jgi:hypothetical protein